MSEMVYLNSLEKGQKAVIGKLEAYDGMRRRLQDIGVIEGTVVECLGKSPLGDPAAFLIRGAVIALRSEDSGRILVRFVQETERKTSFEEEMIAASVAPEDRIWD